MSEKKGSVMDDHQPLLWTHCQGIMSVVVSIEEEMTIDCPLVQDHVQEDEEDLELHVRIREPLTLILRTPRGREWNGNIHSI